MVEKHTSSIEAELVTEGTTCTLDDLCQACGVDAGWIATIVEHGIIEPVGTDDTAWQFTRISAIRAAKARRLERDLDLNVPGIAVVLDLLDQIEELKIRLRTLGH